MESRTGRKGDEWGSNCPFLHKNPSEYSTREETGKVGELTSWIPSVPKGAYGFIKLTSNGEVIFTDHQVYK